MGSTTIAVGIIVLATIGFVLASVNGYLARRYIIRFGDSRATDAAHFFILYGAVLITLFILVPILVFSDIHLNTFVQYLFIISSIPFVGQEVGGAIAVLWVRYYLPRAHSASNRLLDLGHRFARWFDRTFGANEGRSTWRR